MAIFTPNYIFAKINSQIYAEYLEENAIDPIDFVLSKIKDYRLVAIGEDHWIADHTKFFCDVLREAAKNDDTRPQVVAVEFGNEIDQIIANHITHSPIFMPDSVHKILQHAPDRYGNPYKGYFDVFKCVWEINQSLDDNKKISIQLLDPAGVQDMFDNTKFQRNKDRDMSMFHKLQWDITNGKKVIFYAGQAHTQRQIRGIKLNDKEYYYNYPSAGFLIKSAYPRLVYTLDLWSPLNMGMGYTINPNTGIWHERSYGIFDKAFAINGNKPCGFDIKNSAWGNITMMEYYSLPGKENNYMSNPLDANPYTQDIELSQLLDGIVFIKPSSEFKGDTLIDIYTPDFLEKCKLRSGGKITTTEDIFNTLKEWHPILRIP